MGGQHSECSPPGTWSLRTSDLPVKRTAPCLSSDLARLATPCGSTDTSSASATTSFLPGAEECGALAESQWLSNQLRRSQRRAPAYDRPDRLERLLLADRSPTIQTACPCVPDEPPLSHETPLCLAFSRGSLGARVHGAPVQRARIVSSLSSGAGLAHAASRGLRLLCDSSPHLHFSLHEPFPFPVRDRRRRGPPTYLQPRG